MNKLVVDVENDTLKGKYDSNGNVLNMFNGNFNPYDLTYGAISACFSATLIAYAKKKQLNIKQVSVVMDGKKRETVPTTLETIDMDVTVISDLSKQEVDYLVQRAFEKCSMVQTFVKVATFNINIFYDYNSKAALNSGSSCSLKGEC